MTTEPQKGMTPEEMQTRSREKVDKIISMMKLMHVRIEAKQHITQQGFIENVVYWVDDEKYPPAPVEERGPETDQQAQEGAETKETPTEESAKPEEVKRPAK